MFRDLQIQVFMYYITCIHTLLGLDFIMLLRKLRLFWQKT